MGDPFAIDGPALISFSGGRTSGYMLRRILDSGLRPDVRIAFANTGRERPETLDFVHEIESRWGCDLAWLERPDGGGFRRVSYETASRDGSPFASLIAQRKFPPNPVTRFCTQELKIRAIRDWMRSEGFDHWTMVVGIRADEPSRVARMRAPTADRWDRIVPLADAGVTEADVLAYWRAQPFDLRLRTWEGSCDLCFLKGAAKIRRILEDRPDLAAWWVGQESKGATFRSDRPDYAAQLRAVQQQVRMPFACEAEMDDLGDCICHE